MRVPFFYSNIYVFESVMEAGVGRLDAEFFSEEVDHAHEVPESSTRTFDFNRCSPPTARSTISNLGAP